MTQYFVSQRVHDRTAGTSLDIMFVGTEPRPLSSSHRAHTHTHTHTHNAMDTMFLGNFRVTSFAHTTGLTNKQLLVRDGASHKDLYCAQIEKLKD